MNKKYFIKTKNLLTLFLILIFFLAVKSSVSQTTVNISFGRDNTLYENPDGLISNGAGQYFFSGKTVTNQIRRGVIRFDLLEFVPPCAVITNVTLRLHMSKTIVGDSPVRLRKLVKGWGESASDASGEEGFGTFAEPEDATWIHTYYDTAFWSRPGGDFSDSISATASIGGVGYYTWGSTARMVSDVQEWVNIPNSNFGWIIIGDETTAPSAKRFDSFQNDSTNFQPVLSVTYLNNSVGLNMGCLIEGFWNGTAMIPDTMKVTLRSSVSPYPKVDSAKAHADSYGYGIYCFPNASPGTYFIVVNHRNSIETWSKLPQIFSGGYPEYYDFTDSATKAYGDNEILKSGFYCIYSADVNQDDIVEGTDNLLIDNDAANFVTGYVDTDVNGDEVTDGSDAVIAGNNASNFVAAVTP